MDKTKTIIVRVSRDVHDALRKKVIDDDTSVAALVSVMVDNYLSDDKIPL